MGATKTSLSAGEIIRKILADDPEVKARASKIFPVVCDSATLPYVLYRRMGLDQTPVKGHVGADIAQIEVLCFTEGYSEGVELAEAVRNALDGVQGQSDGLKMRSCYLADSDESWQDDAYVQQLVFNIKI